MVVVLLDDMGWSDLGCYGGEVRTPHIDALAAGGLRFTNFYNTSRCCPTRAALLTGLYPHQAGVGRMTFDDNLPGYRGRLGENTVTIAEVLKDSGYRTAMVGKWHLSLTETLDSPQEQLKWLNHQGHFDRPFSDPQTYPVGRGFDEHYGVIWGVVDYFDPFSLVHNTTPVRSVPEDYYITDALTEHAVKSIEEFSTGEQPFFLYAAYTAPHWPLHARPEEIAKYEDAYTAGWDAVREARFKRIIEMGLIDADHAELSPRNGKLRWEDEPNQAWEARAMAVHAAMIDRVDQGVGRIIETLKERKLFDDTLILVLSDNGASPERIGVPGFDRNSETRDGRDVQYFGPNRPKDVLPGPQTTYAGIGPRWANVSNTPFRFWKKETYEGGICTPLVAHWPRGIAAPGAITHQPGHVIDIMATCVDLAGASYPAEREGLKIQPLE
ncbi:MAG: arylsulfatase, partial [Planctomycetaceae bacterium]